MSALSRREREQLRHRDEILEAAGAVFAEKGYYNTTMEDIAQASEFAIGSLYKHFRNKEALFNAVFEHRLIAWVDGLEAVIGVDASFFEILDSFLNHYVDFAHASGPFFRILTTAHRAAEWHSEGVRSTIEPVLDRYRLAVLDLMRRGVSEGALRPLDPGDLTSFTMGVLHAFFHAWILGSEEAELSTKAPMIKDLLLGGIARAQGERQGSPPGGS